MLDILKNRFLDQARSRGFTPTMDPSDPDIIFVDFYIVVLGEFNDSPNREIVLAKVDELLEKVLSVRKTLSPTRASDIYLLLTGQAGSDVNSQWKAIAAEVERDDRLARKHVWLPDVNQSNFNKLIENTFLAKPWDSDEGTTDALVYLNDGIDMPDGWEAALLDQNMESVELVTELIRLETRVST